MTPITLLNFFLAALLPLLLDRLSRRVGGPVQLSSLSIILFVLLGIFIAMSYAHEELLGRVANIYLFIFYRLFTALVSVLAVLKLSPLGSDIFKLIKFPKVGGNSQLTWLILLFLFYGGIIIQWGVRSYPDKILSDSENMLLLRSVLENPVLWIPAVLLTILCSAIGEELVFRYVAISALRNKFNMPLVVIISAAIWSLFHSNISMALFVEGLFFGYIFYRSTSLSLTIFLHFIYNVAVSSQVFYLHLLQKNG